MRKTTLTIICISFISAVTFSGCRKEPKEVSMKMLQKELEYFEKMKIDEPEDGHEESHTATSGHTIEDCELILEKLVRESDFNDNYMEKHPLGYNVYTEEINTQIAIMELRRNKEGNTTIPDGWFELDYKRNKLSLHSGYTKKPLKVKFKKEILEEFKTNCLQHAVD